MKAMAMEEVVLSSICRVFGLSHNLKRPAAISATRMLRLDPFFTIKMKNKHRFGVDGDASRPKGEGEGHRCRMQLPWGHVAKHGLRAEYLFYNRLRAA